MGGGDLTQSHRLTVGSHGCALQKDRHSVHWYVSCKHKIGSAWHGTDTALQRNPCDIMLKRTTCYCYLWLRQLQGAKGRGSGTQNVLLLLTPEG